MAASLEVRTKQRTVIEFLVADRETTIPAKETKVDTLIRANRRITLDELASELGIGNGSAQNIADFLGFTKVRSRWVSRQLTDENKAERVNCSTELL